MLFSLVQFLHTCISKIGTISRWVYKSAAEEIDNYYNDNSHTVKLSAFIVLSAFCYAAVGIFAYATISGIYSTIGGIISAIPGLIPAISALTSLGIGIAMKDTANSWIKKALSPNEVINDNNHETNHNEHKADDIFEPNKVNIGHNAFKYIVPKLLMLDNNAQEFKEIVVSKTNEKGNKVILFKYTRPEFSSQNPEIKSFYDSNSFKEELLKVTANNQDKNENFFLDFFKTSHRNWFEKSSKSLSIHRKTDSGKIQIEAQFIETQDIAPSKEAQSVSELVYKLFDYVLEQHKTIEGIGSSVAAISSFLVSLNFGPIARIVSLITTIYIQDPDKTIEFIEHAPETITSQLGALGENYKIMYQDLEYYIKNQ